MISVTVGSREQILERAEAEHLVGELLAQAAAVEPLGQLARVLVEQLVHELQHARRQRLVLQLLRAQRRQIERLEQQAAQPALQAIALGVGEIGDRGDRVRLRAARDLRRGRDRSGAPGCGGDAFWPATVRRRAISACSATTLGSLAASAATRRSRRPPLAAAAAAACDLAGGRPRRHRRRWRSPAAEAQRERPDLDRLAERQRLRASDALALDEGAVGRQVAHHAGPRP